MAAVTEILYINTDGVAGIRGTPTAIGTGDTVTAKGSWSFTGGPTEFTGNVSITGNLDVAGDIISRSQVNLVIQDSFLDLGFGNTTTTAASGGFTVQMNRTSTFTAGNVTSFDSSSTFTYTDAGSSTLLVAGDIIAITNMPSDLSSNEGFFVVASVDQAAFPQVVTIATSPTASVPFAQTAFVAAAFPATVTPSGLAFQCDIAVLAVADGTSDFKNGAGVAFAKGTFVQAYIPDATASAFQANGAYNVIGGTTLQQAYDSSSNPATILTAAAKPLEFSLNATGPFQVQGPGAIEFGSGALTDVASFGVVAVGGVSLNSTQASATAITIDASNAAGGILAQSGTGGIDIDGDGGSVLVQSNNAAAAAVKLFADNTNAATTIEINSAGTGASALNIDSAGGIQMDAVGAISIDSTSTASNFTLTANDAGAATLTLSATNAGAGTGVVSISADNTINMETLVTASAINIGTTATLDHTISVGTGSGVQKIFIGEGATTDSYTKIKGNQAEIAVGNLINKPYIYANTIDISNLASSGTVAIGERASGSIFIGQNLNVAKNIYIGHSATYAQNPAFGDCIVQIKGRRSYIFVGNNAPNQIDIETEDSSTIGTINIGTVVNRDHAINIGTSGSSTYQTQQITLGNTFVGNFSTPTPSFVSVRGGSAVGLRIESVSGAGVSVINNSGAALSAGEVVSLDVGVTPASHAVPSVTAADAAAVSPYERRFFGVIQKGGIADTASGYATSVAGTVARVAWTSNAGGIPAAGDEGKPVFLESSNVGAAGVATLLAPSASGEAVVQIGYLVSDTADNSLYAVVLAPQFIGQIP